mgnify:CR=1 FL=1
MKPEGEGKSSRPPSITSFRCPECSKEHPLFMTRCPETGRQVDQAHKMEGLTLDGRVLVGRMAAEGGMGVVYEGTNTKIGRKLAIKFLKSSISTNPQMLQRFENEARAAASIGHGNIVDILDMGATPRGVPFIVMEWLDGSDLGDVIDAATRLPPPLAVEIALQMLSALSAAHEKGIVHRDLKPENVFLKNEPGGAVTVKIVDFGISRLGQVEGGGELSVTRTGAVFGTPRYMAPEQARGLKTVDHRVDLYSVGVILYRMLTGALPFEADDYNNLIIAITTEDPVHVTKHGAPIPEGLDAAVMTAIEREPEARFQSASAFAEALLPFRSPVLESLSASSSISFPSIGIASAPARAMTPAGQSGARESDPDRMTLKGDAHVPSSTGQIGGVESQSSIPSIPPGVPAARGRVRGRLLVAGVAGLFLVTTGVVGFLAIKASRLEREMRALAHPMPAPAAPAAAPPLGEGGEEKAVSSFEVVLQGLPARAEVLVDGVLHPERPLSITGDPGSRHVEVVADGYQPWEKDVELRSDLALEVVLVPVAAEPKGGTAKGKALPDAGDRPAGKKTKKKIDVEYPGM